MPELAYYSIIQYCPNPERHEGINVGIVLFWGSGKGESLFIDSCEKVFHMFGPTQAKRMWIDLAKDSIERQIKSIKNLAELKLFINKQMPEFCMTPIKPTKITLGINEDLQFLFKKLVE